jgi:hypothetical protein
MMPECGTCVSYKDDCTWASKSDWRRAVSRAEAIALRRRVADLESELASQRSALGSVAASPTTNLSRRGSDCGSVPPPGGPFQWELSPPNFGEASSKLWRFAEQQTSGGMGSAVSVGSAAPSVKEATDHLLDDHLVS